MTPTGAIKTGGRWNERGTPALYAASSLSLACLEILVHMRWTDLVPPDYVYSVIEVPRLLISSRSLDFLTRNAPATSFFRRADSRTS